MTPEPLSINSGGVGGDVYDAIVSSAHVDEEFAIVVRLLFPAVYHTVSTNVIGSTSLNVERQVAWLVNRISIAERRPR